MKYPIILIIVIVIFGIGAAIFYKKPVMTSKTMKIADKAIAVRLAQTQAEITKGLGGAKLGENEGMLFLFPEQNIKPTFWMKDMIIDLDMIWIDEDKVVDIHTNVPAQTGETDSELLLYSPKQTIDYVLEVNAGFSQKNNIQIGDHVDLVNIKSN